MASLNVSRGDTVYASVAVKDPFNEAVDLTDCTVVLSLRSAAGTLVTVSGIIADALAGLVAFELTPTNTATAGSYRYDIQVTTSNDQVYTIDKGTINILPDISA